jgi:uncharacterized repeat protein (TIGR01451 family)
MQPIRIAIIISIITIFIFNFAEAKTNILNTAKLSFQDGSGNIHTNEASATLEKLSPAKIEVVKKLRNLTRKEEVFNQTTKGAPGEIIEYQIEIKNIGEDKARYIVIEDQLSEGIIFISGSITVNGSTQTDKRDDDYANFSNNKIIIGKNKEGTNGNLTEITLSSNQTLTITYKVKISQ